MLAELLGKGRDDTAVETTTQQYTIGHVTHQLTLHGGSKSVADSINGSSVILHGIVLHPVALIVALHAWFLAPVVVAWQEGFEALTLSLEGLEFAGHIDSTVSIVTDIKRYDANGVTGNEEFVALLVIEHKGKDAAEVFEEVNAFLAIEGKDDLTVATRLEVIFSSKAATNLLMVINLTIDSKDLLAVGREQRLTATLRVHNAQSLVGQDSRATTVDTTPVRSAMADLLTHLQRFITKSLCLLFHIQYRNDSTHTISIFVITLFRYLDISILRYFDTSIKDKRGRGNWSGLDIQRPAYLSG